MDAANLKPTLPADQETLERTQVRALRAFHLGLSDEAPTLAEPGDPATACWPALFSPFRHGVQLRSDFPLFLAAAGEESSEPILCLSPAELLGRALRHAGISAGPLRDNVQRLERYMADLLLPQPTAARPLLRSAADTMVQDLDPAAAVREQLQADLQRLLEAVPEDGVWLGADDEVPLHLLRAVLQQRQVATWARLRLQVRGWVEKLAGLLAEARRRSGEAGANGNAGATGDADNGKHDEEGALGAFGTRFLDTSALHQRLAHEHEGHSANDHGRRQRLEDTHAALLEFSEPSPPRLFVSAQASAQPPPLTETAGWAVQRADDPCGAAAAAFDREASRLTRILRAARTARLELAGDYESEIHTPWLRHFDWRAFSDEEARLLPALAVRLDAEQLDGSTLASLSQLLLSGRPIQILVEVDPSRRSHLQAPEPSSQEPFPAETWEGFRLELAYFGLSHREALVHQTLALRPLHSIHGFLRAAERHRTALHVIGTSPVAAADLPPWLCSGGALDGRAHPLFLYDPEAGTSWAQRMDFGGNPAAEQDWPAYDLAVVDTQGEEDQLRLTFTYVDFALLDPAVARRLRLLPAGCHDDALLELASWLTLDEEDALRRLPFVWVVDADSTLRRALVPRTLATTCRDRLDYWRTLQEMAGTRSEYVERAVELARRDERARLEAQHADELARGRRQTAEQLAERLTTALLREATPSASAASFPASSASRAAVPLAEPKATETAPAPSESKEPTPSKPNPSAPPVAPSKANTATLEAYIDSPLCTSCNECIQINSAMFAYDENKQAYIADASAGTFQQLVKAAERCTAKIIHPGTPLDPDEPGLEEWVRRAQPFQ